MQKKYVFPLQTGPKRRLYKRFPGKLLVSNENQLDAKQKSDIMADGSSIVSPIDRRKMTPSEEIGVHTELLYSGTKDTPSISRTNVN